MYVRCILIWLISCFYSLSAKADCQAPQSLNVYSVTHQSANLYWSSYYGTNPTAYQVQWRVAGSSGWLMNAVTTTSLSLTGLTNNTAYEWRVRSVCATGDTSAYANGTAFQTKCDFPTYLNVNGITHESAQLTWNQPVYGATYEVQWRIVGSSSWTIVSNLTTGYVKLTGLPDQTAFEWVVRTVCSGSVTSDFVSGPIFQTHCLTPTNPRTTLVNSDAVELKWDNTVTNVLYDLQWRPAGTSTWTLVEGIPTNEYSLTGLSNATDYVWQVRTACTSTSKSAFGDAQYFRTVCPAPSTVATGSITYNAAVLQWTDFASDLQWRLAGTTDWITVPNARPPYNLTGLSSNTTYEWRVRTVCSPTVASAYTASQLLTTQCSVPTNVYAYSNQSNGLNLYWSSANNGPFEVQWRISGAANWSTVTGVSGTSYTLLNLVPQTTYEFRVRQLCSSTDYSAFTMIQSGQTSCVAPSYAQVENGTGTTVGLTWGGSTEGAQYEIQWRIVNTTDWVTAANITTNHYGLTNLQSNVGYEWRVRKTCSGVTTSAYTTGQSFTLICQPPSYLYTYNIDVSSVILNWSNGTNIYPPYDVQYRPVGAADWVTVSSVNTTYYSVSGLTNNTTYEWRVRSACLPVSSTDFSAVQTFQTQCAKPSFLTVPTVKYNSVQLSWQNYNSSNRLYEIQYREVGTSDWIILHPEGSETDPTFGQVNYNYTKLYTLYNLSAGKTYEWRIRTQCASATYSDFVAGPSFTTVCAMPQSVGVTQQTNTSVQISWYLSSATTYELQWRTVGTQTWNTIRDITNTNYTITDLTPGGRYEYRVRQVCASGTVSDYTTPISTQLQCFRPDLLQAETLSASSVRLRWRYVNENLDVASIAHELQYRPVGATDWTVIMGIMGTTYSLTGLITGTLYESQVRPVCSPDSPVAFTGPISFSISCPVPTANSYVGFVTATSASLSWNYYSGNPTFQLQWRVAGTTNWSTVTIPASANTNMYAYAYLVTGLLNNTTYEWRVAAGCGNAYLSDFSPVQSFQTTCPAIQSLTTDKISNTSAQLSWSGTNISLGTNFTVQYRASGRVVWMELSGITGTNVLLTGLTNNTTYEWRARTECGNGNTASFSSSTTFTTQCPSPTTLPAIGITARSAILVWDNNMDNVLVNLQWRKANANAGWTVVNGLTSPTYALTGLASSTYYEYQLQGVCSTQNQVIGGSWASNGFTTSSSSTTATLALVVDTTSAQTARLSWLSGPDRSDYILQWRLLNGTWNTSGPLATKRYLLTNLLPNTTYEARLGITDNNVVNYLATSTFATSCPRAYNLSTNDITSNKARLTWATISTPVTMQWRVAGTTAWQSVPGIATGFYTLTGLANNTMYEWRIVTQCSADSTVATYPIAFWTMCSMPGSPTLLNVSTEAALLSWTGTGASYTVQYRVAGTNDWRILSGVTATTAIISGLITNTLYEWSVGSVCESNVSTIFTNAIQFRTQCLFPQNLNISSYSSDFVVLTWNKGGPSMQLQWRMVGQSAWSEQNAVTSPYTLTGLTPNSTYEWRLRATCLAEPDSPFINGSNFTLSPCSTPYGIRMGLITAHSAQILWYANSSTKYGLRWRALGNTNWNVAAGEITSPYTLTGLTNNTIYEWQIRSACQPDYGTSQLFQTHCNSPLVLQTEALTSNSATLRWNDIGDGMNYKIRWRVVGALTWNTTSTIMSTSYSLQGLTNFTAYEWQVGSQCTNDDSDFQVTASFKTVDSNACSQGMYTVKAGSWDDPTVWSCNRLPMATDTVQVKHVITIQTNYVAKALSIRYDTGGQLAIGSGATIQMGN